MTIDKTLTEREQRYGDFTDVAVTAQALQDTMRAAPGWDRLDPVQRQGLTAIADKIGRILSGDPNYPDNWHDIAGYATIVEQRLPAPWSADTDWPPPGFKVCNGVQPDDVNPHSVVERINGTGSYRRPVPAHLIDWENVTAYRVVAK